MLACRLAAQQPLAADSGRRDDEPPRLKQYVSQLESTTWQFEPFFSILEWVTIPVGM
jgi:hypothetical protein